MQRDREFLYNEIEPLVDGFHKNLPIFKRDRDVALIHLLRHFEDRARFRTMRALFSHGEVEFFTALQHAQDGLVWATRWIWTECPRLETKTLQLDWEAYEQAAQLFLHSADYYHLYRCIVLCRRGHFDAIVSPTEKRVQFTFRSDKERKIDAARQLRETTLDATLAPSDTLQNFMHDWLPLVRELFPCWLEKTDEHSIRYSLPPLITWIFARWAGLQVRQMEFGLPGAWQFGDYTLDQFRSFWKSLLAAALAHLFAHMRGDGAAGTTGLTVGSVVMQRSAAEMETALNG